MARKVNNTLMAEEIQKTDAFDKIKVRCFNCGHTMVILYWEDKKLCEFCGHYRFRTPKLEFEYRLKERLNRIK